MIQKELLVLMGNTFFKDIISKLNIFSKNRTRVHSRDSNSSEGNSSDEEFKFSPISLTNQDEKKKKFDPHVLLAEIEDLKQKLAEKNQEFVDEKQEIIENLNEKLEIERKKTLKMETEFKGFKEIAKKKGVNIDLIEDLYHQKIEKEKQETFEMIKKVF